MRKQKAASTMSVPEMRELLGIKKTDSYWLIKKQLFETILYNGEIRIVKKSFERWYAGQDHYCKVTGEKPGEKLHKTTYKVQDVADMLGISCDSVISFIRNHGLPYTVDVQNHHTIRINKAYFDKWLNFQSHYRTKEQREKDAELIAASVSIPEMGRMLGLDRREAYKLAYRYRNEFETIVVGDRKRITIESFERWYQSQDQYEKVPANEVTAADQASADKEFIIKASYTVREAAEYLQEEEQQIHAMLADGTLTGRKVGKTWRISYDDLCRLMDDRRTENGINY